MTLVEEIRLEANWYGVGIMKGFDGNDDEHERAIKKTRFAVFGQYQTGLDRF